MKSAKVEFYKRITLAMTQVPEPTPDYSTEFSRWWDHMQGEAALLHLPIEETAQRAWYAAVGVILNKLEDELDTSIEFEQEFETDLIQNLIKFLQDEL